jgi:hypothetical protein
MKALRRKSSISMSSIRSIIDWTGRSDRREAEEEPKRRTSIPWFVRRIPNGRRRSRVVDGMPAALRGRYDKHLNKRYYIEQARARSWREMYTTANPQTHKRRPPHPPLKHNPGVLANLGWRTAYEHDCSQPATPALLVGNDYIRSMLLIKLLPPRPSVVATQFNYDLQDPIARPLLVDFKNAFSFPWETSRVRQDNQKGKWLRCQ